MIIDYRGERLAGGLDGSTWQPGRVHEQLGIAIDINVGQWKRRAYESRRRRSIANRVRMRHLPAAEAKDHRFHEMRAAGWSPLVEVIRVWFFALSDDDRRELVAMARRGNAAYFRAKFDRKPQLVTVTSATPGALGSPAALVEVVGQREQPLPPTAFPSRDD